MRTALRSRPSRNIGLVQLPLSRSGTVPRKGPWLWSQTDPSLSPLFWFPAQGPLASYLASPCFCFLICELG